MTKENVAKVVGVLNVETETSKTSNIYMLIIVVIMYRELIT